AQACIWQNMTTNPSFCAFDNSSSRPSDSLKFSQSIDDLATVEIVFGPCSSSSTLSSPFADGLVCGDGAASPAFNVRVILHKSHTRTSENKQMSVMLVVENGGHAHGQLRKKTHVISCPANFRVSVTVSFARRTLDARFVAGSSPSAWPSSIFRLGRAVASTAEC